MPNYSLICSECGFRVADCFLTMREREDAFCTECGCADSLENDYSRPHGANFQLKGNNWPGKNLSLETKLLKDGESM